MLPETRFTNVDVFVHLPTNRHVGTLLTLLHGAGYATRRVDGGILVEAEDFEDLLALLETQAFNPLEQAEVRVLPLPHGETPGFASLRHHRSLVEWGELVRGREVIDIISDARIRTLFQPIVEARTGEIFGYEALSRGVLPDGSVLRPDLLFGRAKKMDLLFPLDRACREAAIRAAAHAGIDRRLFINFVPTAIYEPSLCLQSTARVLSEVDVRADQIVFEVVESERVEDFEHLNRILDYYRDRGYSTALDDIGAGYSDVGALVRLRPDFMKVDMNVVRGIDADPAKQELLAVFMENATRIGATILAEGIETPAEYRFLRDQGVHLMQGYLFGRPEREPIDSVSLPAHAGA